jgi:hypothetical protein
MERPELRWYLSSLAASREGRPVVATLSPAAISCAGGKEGCVVEAPAGAAAAAATLQKDLPAELLATLKVGLWCCFGQCAMLPHEVGAVVVRCGQMLWS